MKLRLGIVGAGDVWESRYLPVLRVLADRFQVRAMYEPVAERARLSAEEIGAEAQVGFRAMCRRPDIDAVLILSNSWLGHIPILAACEYGKAVYLGSRVHLSLRQFEEVRQAVSAAGVAFMAELPHRYAPATLRLKELLATKLGALRLIFCHRRLSRFLKRNGTPIPPPQPIVKFDLVELVDWCRFVVGAHPSSVSSVMHVTGDDAMGADYMMMSLDFSPLHEKGKGPVAQISCGRYIPEAWTEAIAYRPPPDMQVACREGIAFLDLPAGLVWFDQAGRHQERLDHERSVDERMLLQFHRAVTSLVQRIDDLETMYQVLKTVQQAVDSHPNCRAQYAEDRPTDAPHRP